MSTPAPDQPRLRRAALGTGLVFAVAGLLFASWVSRLPAIRDTLDATPRQLGPALLGSGLGALLAMPLSGRAAQRFGSRAVVATTAVSACVVLPFLAVAPSVPALGVVLVALGALFGTWDVAMNIQGSAVERRAQRPWMPRYHGAFSAGGIVGAAAGALAAALHVPVGRHLLVTAVVCSVLVLLGLGAFIDERTDRPAAHASSEPRRRVLTRSVLLIGLVTLCGTVIEGAAADWLALYLNDGRHVGPSAAALGYATFAAAMAASRFAGTPVLDRLGRVRTVRTAAALAGVGVATTVLSPWTVTAYLGAALWGLGVALIFPAAMSAGGEQPGRSEDSIAAVATIGYGGFLLGPPLIGLLAGGGDSGTGLGTALLVLVALAALAAALAPAMRTPGVDARLNGSAQVGGVVEHPQ